MTIKHNQNNLKAFLDDLLKEDNPAPPPASAADIVPVETPKDVSLDQVVDRYFIRYEKESIPIANDYEKPIYGENNKPKHFSIIVNEALNVIKEQDPEEEDPGLDLGAGDEGGGDTGTAEETPKDDSGASDEQQPVISTPQINLNNFAKSVARLINNFDALLNPKDIILNRAEAYITSNYDERTARELMDILDTNYSLRTLSNQEKREDELAMANPYAQGALSKEG